MFRRLMQQKEGTHNLYDAKVGDECAPLEFEVTEEMVEKFLWGNDDYNPWYMEDSPFGGRIATPTFLISHAVAMFVAHFANPPGGYISTKQEFEFLNPIRIGKKVRMTGRMTDRYSRKGREHFVFEFLAVDEDGKELVRIGRTWAAPISVGGNHPKQAVKEKKDEKLPVDPTAFQPMRVTASRETEVGFELEPITKKVTLDKSRIFSGWPQAKLFHNDYAVAQKAGFPRPIVMGNQIAEHLGELIIKFFGKGYLGGKLSMSVIRSVEPDDEITTRGVVREKVAEGNAIRLILDVWCENQRGEKVIVGTASGLVW